MQQHRKLWATVACLASSVLFASPAYAEAAPGPGCHMVRIADTAGRLCDTGSSVVQILVHGATYTKSYWNAPKGYSYQQQAWQADVSTLAVDRVGHGDSTSVNPLLNTTAKQAKALHQVVQWAKGRFDTVHLMGHSMGAAIAQRAAATYHGVDGLILTGFTHHTPPGALLNLLGRARPILTKPGALALPYPGRKLFGAAPELRQWDKRHMEPFSLVEIATAIAPAVLTSIDSSRVTADVLLLNGNQDPLFCTDGYCNSAAELEANEEPYYPRAASFTARVIPSDAHSMALAQAHDEAAAAALTWTKRHSQ